MIKGLLHISHRAIYLAWLSGNIFAMFLMVFVAYCGYISPRVFAFAQTLNLTFPLWVVLGVVLLVANLFFWRKLSLIWCLMMVICAGPIFNRSPLNLSKVARLSPEDSTRLVTVMTYNVMNFYDYDDKKLTLRSPTLQYILDVSPDIVCMQEFDSLLTTDRTNYVDQRNEFFEMYKYKSECCSRGQYVVSKYPIIDITPRQPNWKSGGYQAYKVDIKGYKWLLINLHLQSMGFDSDERSRYRELTDSIRQSPRAELSFVRHTLLSKLHSAFRSHCEQAQHIVAFVDSVAGDDSDVLIVGDFNDTQGSYPYRLLRRKLDLDDIYASLAVGPTITYNRNRFYFHIDHMLYRGALKPISITSGGARSSDHFSMMATILLPED